MLSTSFALRRQLAENTRLLVKATLTLASGTVRNLTNDDIMMGSLSIKDSVSSSSAFDIGAAVMGRCNVTLNNYDERFDDYDFTGATLEPYVGAELPNGTVEWLRRGVFHVDQPDSYGNSIGLESLDNMTLFEVAWETIPINLPATCGTIVQAMCNTLGVTLNTPAFAGYGTVVPATTDTENMTALEMLSAIAQITGNFARFDAWGRLNLSWYPTSCYEGEDWYDGNTDTLDGGSATANGGALGHKSYAHIQSITNLTVMTDDVVITGVRVTAQDHVAASDSDEDHDGETYLYGTEGYVLEIADNKLVPYGTAQAIATQVGQRVVGMRFRPLRLSMTLNPALEAGDAIIVTDGRQRQYRSYITSLDFRVGSYEGVSCDAESPGRHTANSRSAATRAIVDLRNSVKREKTARENAIDSMGQRLDNASGLYETQQVQQDGSTIYYMHDKPAINESTVIMKVTAEGVGISTDGGQTYPTALDVDGDAILRRIYAIGLDAQYINTGRLVVGPANNPIFFADFDTNQVGIGAMGSVGGRTAEQVNQLIDSSATDVDVEFNQNQSTSVAPAQDDSGWSTTPPQWRSGYYIWQRVRTDYAGGTTEYTSPVCISGRDGSTGTNAATIYLFQKSATKPSGIANQITYYFDDGTTDGSLGNWSRGIPEGEETCWVTVATAIGNSASDVIAANEWSDPVQLAAGGVDGLSQATIYLFKRSNTSSSIVTNEILIAGATIDSETAELYGDVSGETLTLSSDVVEPPSTALTYTFETGVLSGDLEGWSRTVPPGDGVIWVTTAVAISSESTDTIAANEWAVPAKLAEDGTSIAVSKVEYAVGTSGTTAPTTGWVEHVPTVAQGMWLWSKMTESDGTELLSVSYQGNDGEDGISVAVRSVVKVDGVTTVTLESSNGQISTLTIADGEDGDTGVPGAGGYVHVAWANSADGNTDFSTTVSADKLYMGVYTDQTEADSQAPSSYTWTLIKGEDGRGIVSTTTSYAASSSGSSIPSTGWQSTIPSVAQGQWLWVRNVDTYTDNTTTTTYSKSYQGTDGEDGTSVNIVGSSKTGGVTTVILEDASGQHTLRIADGEDGDDGAAGADGYTHFAYATSADGSQGFSTTESAGKNYIGVYADHTQADSQRYQDYTWSLIKGADGSNGSSTAVVMLYKRTSAGIRIVGETLEADEGSVSGDTLVLASTITDEVLEASFASLVPPSGTLTYTFETGLLSGNLQGWSQSIPAGREPCYVISATATSTGPTDTITPGEWADAALIADNGTSVYVSSIHYAVSMSETQPTSGWSTSPPLTVAEGAWLWIRVTYSDGNMSYSRSKQGESGTSTYTHIRYSVNASGNPMVVTPTEETCYIGIFVGNTATAPETYGSYTWSRYAGTDGVNSATITLYKRAATTPAKPTATMTYTFATAALTPASALNGWTREIPSGTDPLWAISASAVSSGAADTISTSEWSEQVKFAEHGTNQATINLYARRAAQPSKPSGTFRYTFATGDLSVRSGTLSPWTRNIPASNGKPCYVISATAVSTATFDDIDGTEFSDPVLFVEDGVTVSKVEYGISSSSTTAPTSYSATAPTSIGKGRWLWVRTTYSNGLTALNKSYVGTDGEDGTSIYVTSSTKSGDTTTVNLSDGTTLTIKDGEDGATGAAGKNGYVHTAWANSADGSTDFSTTSSADKRYLGVYTDNKAADSTDYSKYSWSLIKGADGIDGVNSATITLYKRAATTPAKPNAAITYTFATSALAPASALNGWTREVPSGTDPCWITSAVAISNEDTDTIAASEWSAPTKLVVNGLNQATIRLYKRATSSPALPTATITYTFETGALSGSLNGWSTTVPASDGTPCWTTQATAISTGATDTIASGEWATPASMVEDGYNQATIYLYVRGTATPTKPSAATTYNFSTGVLSPIPTGWSRSIPSGTAPLWQITAIALSTTTTDSIAASNWSDPVKLVQNGEDGVSATSIVEQYYLSTSNTSRSGGSWSATQPDWVSGKYIWIRTKTTWSDGTTTYTTPILAAAINKANETADSAKNDVATLDSNLYAREVYNRLTHDNANQGVLYDENGSLYINATYINTGILTVTNGSTTVFSANLDTGVVSIDASAIQMSAGKSLTQTISELECQYATCGTAASTRSKVAYLTNGTLSANNGVMVTVRFLYANSVANPTLTIGSASAAITLNGEALPQSAWWGAGDVLTFVYREWLSPDGGGRCWDIVDSAALNKTVTLSETVSQLVIDEQGILASVSGVQASYGTCSTGSSTQLKSVGISDFRPYVGKTVTVRFSYANTASNPRLEVYDSGDPSYSAIGYMTVNGDSLGSESSYRWSSGDVITFVWTGSAWAIGDGMTMSRIKQTATSIELSVSNASLGNNASIILDVNGVKQTKKIDLRDVRSAFADDTSSVTISAGVVTFNSNTFAVNSSNLTITSSGSITSTGGSKTVNIDDGVITFNYNNGSYPISIDYYNGSSLMIGNNTTRYIISTPDKWISISNSRYGIDISTSGVRVYRAGNPQTNLASWS